MFFFLNIFTHNITLDGSYTIKNIVLVKGGCARGHVSAWLRGTNSNNLKGESTHTLFSMILSPLSSVPAPYGRGRGGETRRNIVREQETEREKDNYSPVCLVTQKRTRMLHPSKHTSKEAVNLTQHLLREKPARVGTAPKRLALLTLRSKVKMDPV